METFAPTVSDWFKKEGCNMVGDYPLSIAELQDVKCLLYTCRDIFNSDSEMMPITDLVMHTIPTYSHIRP